MSRGNVEIAFLERIRRMRGEIAGLRVQLKTELPVEQQSALRFEICELEQRIAAMVNRHLGAVSPVHLHRRSAIAHR